MAESGSFAEHRWVEEFGGSASVELGGTSAASGRGGPGRFDEALGAGDLAVEVPRVEFDVPDHLVDVAEVGDGELVGAEGGGERGVLELGAGAFDPIMENLGVVEGQRPGSLQELRHRVPLHAGGVTAGGGRREVGHKREVGHGDHSAARVASGVAVGGELLEVAA